MSSDDTEASHSLESALIRLLYTILFYLLWQVVEIAVLLLAVIQSLFIIFKGVADVGLARRGRELSLYSQQLVDFLGASSEERPFPFSDWPSTSSDD